MSKVNILIVDDNPSDIRLTKYAIQDSKIDCNIEFALDGEEALSLLNKEFEFEDCETPDLIFLDLNLPKENGLTILKHIRTHTEFENTKVVIISGSEANSDRARANELEVDGFVYKDADIDVFSEKLKQKIMSLLTRNELA